jgi:hypothetical protein
LLFVASLTLQLLFPSVTRCRGSIWVCESVCDDQGWVNVVNPEHGPLTAHLSVELQPLPAMLSGAISLTVELLPEFVVVEVEVVAGFTVVYTVLVALYWRAYSMYGSSNMVGHFSSYA